MRPGGGLAGKRFDLRKGRVLARRGRPPRPAPDPDDPQFREADEFLGSRYIAWPEETIRELLGR